MGTDLFRKYATSSIIICYRSLINHPFLVGMILFLFLMQKLFPLLFSILVSASPVLVSTAVLLGTLLSFGNPNLPEIEIEPDSEQTRIRKLESEGVSRIETVESLPCEEVNGSRVEVVEKSFEELAKGSDVVDDGLLRFGEIDEEKVVLGSRYSPLQQSEDEHIVLESDKLWEGSTDPVNSNSGLLWKVNGGGGGGGNDDDDEDDDEDDDGSDSGSDIAESSSPDASMADIIPMLDELHPLLSEEQETHQRSHVSRDAVSEHSLESDDTSSESNDDDDDDDTGAENHESLKMEDKESIDKDDAITWTEDDQKNLMNLGTSELERNRRLENLVARRRAQKEDTGVENHENLKMEDEESIDKDDVMTWTEDDQKNLMNLGTSELERNRRLENLIARRRARKTMRMQAERNLIDLESSDLAWNIPPISTARNNPFDYDANDDIPGSAPSVLLQRRNPFDLPYDSSEEKPDLVGDTFQQEFTTFQPKEPLFRRHESFNVGPSSFGASRSERQESRLKPYFVPERSFASFQRQFSGLSESKTSSVPDTESVTSDVENKDHGEEEEHGSDHVASFQRQFSGLSESKVSSVPDTESVTSDVENKDHVEEEEHGSEAEEHESDHVSHARPYFVPEHVDETRFSSFQRQLSEVSESKVSSEPDTESVSSVGDVENKDHIDLSQQPDLISLEDPRGADEAETSVESVTLTHQQELHSSGSSSSSSDEASEQVYNEKEGDEVAPESVSETAYFLDRGSSIERTETDVTSLLVEASQPNEPVYDLSPRSVTRNLSSSSILIDLHKDESFQHTDVQNQVPAVPDNEEHVLAARSYESFHQEDVMAQPGDESRSNDKPLVEDLEDLQARDIEDISQPQEEVPLLDTSVNEPSEDNPEAVQITSNNLDNLQIQEPDVVEVADIETQAQEIPACASDTHSIKSNVDEAEEIKEIDEDLLMELDAVGDFSVNDFGSTLNEMKEDPHTSEHELETRHADLETSHYVDEVSSFRDLGSTFDEMKHECDIETKFSGDEDSDSNDLEPALEETKQDPIVVDHDLETMHSEDDDSHSKDATLDELKQDQHESSQDLETKHSEDEDFYSKDATLDEVKQDPHESSHDLETKHSGDEDSYSKEETLDEVKQDPRTSDHDFETKHFEDEDSYSKDATLVEKTQDPHESSQDIETKHYEDDDSHSKDATLEEMKQDAHESSQDLEVKHSEDDDSFSMAATLDEIKQESHESSQDTKHSKDEDSCSKDATLDNLKLDPRDSSHDLETKHSGDEDSDPKSRDLGSTLDEMKQDPPASDHDHETNQLKDEDSYSKDLDTTFSEMKGGSHALEHRLETFYSVDENFYSKHVESAFNEMKQDLHVSDQDHAEVMKSQNENDISNVNVESAFQAVASGSKVASDVNEVVLSQETVSTTFLADSTNATTVNHGTENASTSITDKE
ncbi:uncharacterized protein LOC143574265 [Bidens hawaiensis]|uniref:uncharacterized protein LOC143574265 n=1 Tax=Bidens hawaiensis TaxID=980011 RepID=UPI004049E64D